MSKPIIIIAGVGNGTGTGAAVAREYAMTHRIALLARYGADELASQLVKSGAEAKAFTIKAYDHTSIAQAFAQLQRTWPDSRLRTAVWNASQWSRIGFLDVREEDIRKSTQINIVAAFAFAQQAIRCFLAAGDKPGGTLLVTGATSATRGASHFATFAAGKHGLRAMTHAISREFGERDVHACFCIVDGVIRTAATERNFGAGGEADWLADPRRYLRPESIAKTYRYIDEQPPSAWTLELDLRPAHEKF